MDKAIIDETTEQVTELVRSYELWWFLLQKENAKRYSPVEVRHPEFFITVINSMLQSFCVNTGRLFDKDKHHTTKSLLTVIDELPANDPLRAQLMSKIDAETATLDKVRKLRNKVFGHRDRWTTPQDLFKLIGLTPKEMESVVTLARQIAVELAGPHSAEVDEEFRRRSDAVIADTYSLMSALEKYGDQ